MNWVGKPLRRKEDHRFITGSGKYLADVAVDATHMYVLRSPHASARIVSVSIRGARQIELAPFI
jgi:aerobic carbon-monoxide dehydrogenase large subunit